MKDIRCVAEFAEINRGAIAQKILAYLGVQSIDRVESVHNYVGEDRIIRKGAVVTYKEQRLVIPFNMENGLILEVGKGNAG